MNIMLFLTHKSDITYLFDDYTIEEGLNILRETLSLNDNVHSIPEQTE